jgi:hypothetical protein
MKLVARDGRWLVKIGNSAVQRQTSNTIELGRSGSRHRSQLGLLDVGLDGGHEWWCGNLSGVANDRVEAQSIVHSFACGCKFGDGTTTKNLFCVGCKPVLGVGYSSRYYS